MIPTLFGRWQTRIFLLVTIGSLVTLPFAFSDGIFNPHYIYFWVLFYVGLFGLAWDIFYNFLQKFFWDHDWPGVLQLLAGIVEAIVLVLLIKFLGLPHIDADNFEIYSFIKHYSLVWLSIYLSSWSIMKLLFPQWRFRGGEWIGKWSKIEEASSNKQVARRGK